MQVHHVFLFATSLLASIAFSQESPAPTLQASERPNVIFIISDDHATNALGTRKEDSPVPLPGFAKLAAQGMVFDKSYCTNSICGPSRASILTGRHSHKNGFVFNGQKPFDGAQPTFPKMLQAAGYQTSYIGKWHLESDPTGFDKWEILPGQGSYYNPEFIGPKADGKGNQKHKVEGYATDIITDKATAWLDNRDKSKPFLLYIGHKSPHRSWAPPSHLLGKVNGFKLTLPANLHDDYKNRPKALAANQQTLRDHTAIFSDLKVLKDLVPQEMLKDIVSPGYGWDNGELARMNPQQREAWRKHYTKRTNELIAGMKSGKLKDKRAFTEWKWRAYMEDYLECIMSVDENITRLMEYLDKNGLTDNTIVIYCGDQSFYMGEHGLYDKRWILEESMRMPLIIRFPKKVAAGTRSNALVQNIDYAPTILELTGTSTTENMKTFQGVSLSPLFADGKAPQDWRKALYYCFYENPGEHNCPRHDGIRTDQFTYSRIWTTNEWMLFDNKKDPHQMRNVIADPAYKATVEQLKLQYEQTRTKYQVPENIPGSSGPKPQIQANWD